MPKSILILITARFFLATSTTTTGITPAGKIYKCVAIGSPCPTVAGLEGKASIDPRIILPNDFCSPGYLPCYATEKECGERFVDSINLEDGEADRGAHPWQVYMRNLTSNFSGSGVLLDAFHVLTIAHKVEGNRENPADITVYLGVWDPTNLSDTQYSQVKEVIKNISFDNDTLMNDIAILRLEHPIALGVQDNINTICLPEPETTFAGTSCMVSGWGQSAFQTFDAPTSPQKQVRVTITDPESCQRSFARPTLLGNLVDYYLDQEGEICAGGEANKDACSQDGGSPLICPDSTGKLVVAGLVIWGKNCGQPGVFGVYVNVPYYSKWVKLTIEKLNAKYIK
ncbi:phenoloxidase-activating factor 2 [Dendroctonus ponderosae]